MKLIIAGSRGFTNYELMKEKLNHFLKNHAGAIEIVSGTAQGADQLGERYAAEYGYPVKRFPADWSLGRRAGYIRNMEMAEYGTHAVLFWDGKSPGTRMMKEMCKTLGVDTRVIRYKTIIQ